MKKLNKLQINSEKLIDSEKLMKNEELLVLRGGYFGLPCWWGTNGGPAFMLRCVDCSYGYITVEGDQDYC